MAINSHQMRMMKQSGCIDLQLFPLVVMELTCVADGVSHRSKNRAIDMNCRKLTPGELAVEFQW